MICLYDKKQENNISLHNWWSEHPDSLVQLSKILKLLQLQFFSDTTKQQFNEWN